MIELRVLTGSCVLELKCAVEKLCISEGSVVELTLVDESSMTPELKKTSTTRRKDICRYWRDRVKLLLSTQTY